MASSQKTVDYILEQIAGAGPVAARRMFGEFGVYLGGKIVAFVCDDQLYVKPTEPGRVLLERETGQSPPATGSFYPGSKQHFVIAGELWDDAAFLASLIRETARALPEPTPKKPRVKTSPEKKAPAKKAKR